MNKWYSPDVRKKYSPLPFCRISLPPLSHPGFRASPYLKPKRVPLPKVPLLNSHRNSSNSNAPIMLPVITPTSSPVVSPRSSGTMRGKPDDETGLVAVVGPFPKVVDAALPELEGIAVCVTVCVVVETERVVGKKLGVVVCEGGWGEKHRGTGSPGSEVHVGGQTLSLPTSPRWWTV